jgi:hypothetical protein
MKKFNRSILYSTIALASLSSCDKGFEEMNIDPQAVNKLDAGLLFTNAQRQTFPSDWEGESTVAQQFQNAYNQGATSGFNYNDDVDNFNNPRWNNSFPNAVKYFVHIISLVKDDPTKSNLYNQTRIWKAYTFMNLVDTYGDVPYSDAGLAFLEGNFYPKYDKSADIYADLYNEIKTATAALDPAKDYNRNDLFYSLTGNAAAQTVKWKRLGNSLLLRLGMRYSKLDAAKAKSIVQEAFNGGVMDTNDDNAVIKYMTADGKAIPNYPNPRNQVIRITNPYFYYLAEPLITRLKNASDPRLKYISAAYPNQAAAPQNTAPDTTLENQFGFPVGYSEATLKDYPGYRAPRNNGQNYSQTNYNVVGNQTTPLLFITNAQTKLLLAEAAYKGWLIGLSGAKSAKEYYEEGVKAAMDNFDIFPNVILPKAVPNDIKEQYLAGPNVAYNDANALDLINTQYWITCFGDGLEAWANFRRSGFPALKPNGYKGGLPNGGFVRKFPYPIAESSSNTVHYNEAIASMGGNSLTTRIFWDKE